MKASQLDSPRRFSTMLKNHLEGKTDNRNPHPISSRTEMLTWHQRDRQYLSLRKDFQCLSKTLKVTKAKSGIRSYHPFIPLLLWQYQPLRLKSHPRIGPNCIPPPAFTNRIAVLLYTEEPSFKGPQHRYQIKFCSHRHECEYVITPLKLRSLESL